MFDPPAIQYPHFCMWPDKVHDHFRDGLYHSPLSYVASRYCTVLNCTVLYCTFISRLMGNASVRVQNTFTMGAEANFTIPV